VLDGMTTADECMRALAMPYIPSLGD